MIAFVRFLYATAICAYIRKANTKGGERKTEAVLTTTRFFCNVYRFTGQGGFRLDKRGVHDAASQVLNMSVFQSNLISNSNDLD